MCSHSTWGTYITVLYVMVEVNTYQKAVVDLSRKQSRQLSTSPINNYNNSKTKTKTSVVVPVTFSSKKSSDSNNNNNNNNGNILNQQHHSTTLESTPGNDKSRDSDCCWGVFVLDIPKLKYFSSSMIAVQPYPIPSPLNPTSRSNLSSHDYSRCMHVDIMLSKKEVDIWSIIIGEIVTVVLPFHENILTVFRSASHVTITAVTAL